MCPLPRRGGFCPQLDVSGGSRVCHRTRTPRTQDRVEETDFGQSRFGQSIFGHRGFGQSQFWPVLFWPIRYWPFGSGCVSWPRRGGPRGGRPKISRFFFRVPLPLSLFSSLSLWGSSRGFWWCLKRRGFEMFTFGLSGCRVKPRRPRSRRGFTRQPESPNVHI